MFLNSKEGIFDMAHEHEHKHCSCCGCGEPSCPKCGEHDHDHEHGDGENTKRDIIIVLICAAVFALSFIPVLEPYTLWLCLAAAVVAGRETIIEGIKGIFRLDFGEETLMTIAVIAAFVIGDYREGAMVALLFSLGEGLEDLAVDRSKENIAALADIRPDMANVVTESGTEARPAEEISVGTRIFIKVGERVPLDCRVEENDATADASALTGESLPVTVARGEVLKAGCVVLERPVVAETVSEYGDSAAARIIDMVQNAAEKKGATEKFISKFCRIYTPVVIGLAALVFLVGWLSGILAPAEAAHRALVFLVSSCPCALVLSVPLAYFAGIGSASRHGVLIKGSEYCERLAQTKNAVFDKTGTLTTGKLHVSEIRLCSSLSEEEVLRLAAAAEKYSDHPVAKCVVETALSRNLSVPESENATETAGEGVTVLSEGKSIACGNEKLLRRLGISLEHAETANLYVSVDGVLTGCIILEDTLRPEAIEAIKKLRSLGVEHAYMLTGDNEHAAAKVASECGLDGYFASLMPEDKVARVEKIKKSGSTVFTGDGINDAPVLAAADVGAAMGMGTDAAIESADIVLMRGGVSALAKAVAISKKIMRCVHQNVVFIMAVKVAVLILGVLGYAPIWLAVFADVGVCMLALVWSLRLLRVKL